MAVTQEMLKSDLPSTEKHATILYFDRVLGLSWTRSTLVRKIPPKS